MNIDLAIKIITGLLALLLGVVGWELRTSVEDHRTLRSEFDLFRANIEPRMAQSEGELDNLWIMKNKDIDAKLQETKDQGLFYVDMMGRVMVLESNQVWIMKNMKD